MGTQHGNFTRLAQVSGHMTDLQISKVISVIAIGRWHWYRKQACVTDKAAESTAYVVSKGMTV